MKTARRLFTAIMLVFLFTLATANLGCGGGKTLVHQIGFEQQQAYEVSPKAQNFAAGIIRNALVSLTKSYAGGIAGDVLGKMLDVVGFGTKGDSAEKQLLQSMDGKLDEIKTELGLIQETLTSILQNLALTKETIIANINDPTDAINSINTLSEKLQEFAISDPGSVNTGPDGPIVAFIDRVEKQDRIDEQIRRIYAAIIPDTIGKTPALSNFTDLSLDQIKEHKKDLKCAYLGLENYFSQLLIPQVKGVNLLIEAKNFEQAAQPSQDGEAAKDMMKSFREVRLKPEMANFMNNVWYLILGKADVQNADSFLPPEAPEILSRASFFQTQIVNLKVEASDTEPEPYGLKGTLIGPQDYVSGIVPLVAKSVQSNQEYQGVGTTHTVTGTYCPAYDSWVGNEVQPKAIYTVITYVFPGAPLGEYMILDSSNAKIADAQVMSYTEDYVLDPTGGVYYGHFTIGVGASPQAAFDGNCSWKMNSNSGKSTTTTYSVVGDKWIQLEGTTGKFSISDRSYSGDSQLEAHFRYSGDADIPITVHYGVHATGNAKCTTNWVAWSNVHYDVGLWDVTNNQLIKDFDKAQYTLAVSSTDKANKAFEKTLTETTGTYRLMNPVNNNEYCIVYRCHVDASTQTGSASGSIKLSSIVGNVFLTF